MSIQTGVLYFDTDVRRSTWTTICMFEIYYKTGNIKLPFTSCIIFWHCIDILFFYLEDFAGTYCFLQFHIVIHSNLPLFVFSSVSELYISCSNLQLYSTDILQLYQPQMETYYNSSEYSQLDLCSWHLLGVAITEGLFVNQNKAIVKQNKNKSKAEQS